MQKRFCDLCDTEIPPTERYYDVMLQVKIANESNEQSPQAQQYADFCYACTKSGKALTDLMHDYEESLKVKA